MSTVTEMDRIIERCLGGELPPCQAACPLRIDVKGYIALISQGKWEDALKLIRERLPFPGIIGRICTRPCEASCIRADVEQAIAINALKRCAADWGEGGEWDLSIAEEREERVAIIGAGPAGLMAAHDLRKLGYQVTIFEALPFPGGMMRVGIPRYRLPREVLQREIEHVLGLGIELRLNSPVHRPAALFDNGYQAAFLATGMHQGRRLSIPGVDLDGVLDGLSFLRQLNAGRKVALGSKVLVLGGGSVACDVARSARRLGVPEVHMACLESRETMPAQPWELEQAEEEGVVIHPSCTFTRILGDNGHVVGVECLGVKWMKFDEEGQLHLEAIEGSEQVLEADTVIFAVGQALDPTLVLGSDISLTKRGTIAADPVTLQTGRPGMFAGGEAVSGPASVIDALAAGRKAAISIDRYLKGENLTTGREEEGPRESRLAVDIAGVAKEERIAMPTLPRDQRVGDFREVELGLSMEQARREAERCLGCECRLCIQECEFLRQFRQLPGELAQRFKAGYFREKPEIPYSCSLCGLCPTVCPEKLNLGEMFLELRRQLVAEGLGPLPQHDYLYWNLDFSTSDSFALAQPDPETGTCERVFFPGCSLSGYSPSLVIKTYDYLRGRLPGTGILLNCCGAPVRDIGEQGRFQQILDAVAADMERLGASEIIVACSNCYRSFKYNAPRLKLRSLYEVMVELGLPDDIPFQERTFSLHDSCPARWEREIQESVRVLLRRMGYGIEELEYSRENTRCCGLGGMVAYVDVWLAFNVTKRRNDEAHFDMVSYCATCREAFASPFAGEKPSLHILDLIFNPDWEQARLKPPNEGSVRRDNQGLLKSQLVEGVSDKAEEV